MLGRLRAQGKNQEGLKLEHRTEATTTSTASINNTTSTTSTTTTTSTTSSNTTTSTNGTTSELKNQKGLMLREGTRATTTTAPAQGCT